MKFKKLLYIFSIISFTYGQYNLNIYTINRGVITGVSIISMNVDSVEILTNKNTVILNIDDISQLQFKRTFARGLFTCIGVFAGATVGALIGLHNWEPDDVSKNPPKFLKDITTRLYISSVFGSIIFGYLGYARTNDLMYEMKDMDREEKVNILEKIKT